MPEITETALEIMPGQIVELQGNNENVFTQVGTSSSPSEVSLQTQNAQTATINVNYNGFTPEAQAAFEYAVDIWEGLIESDVTIDVDANFTSLGFGVLGSAGPAYNIRDFSGAPQANTWYSAALGNKLAGTDLNTNSPDITTNLNSNFSNWYFGTDGNTPAGEYDFVTVVLHELAHGLGFSGLMQYNNGEGSWGVGTGFPGIYDRFTVNGSNQSPIDMSQFPNPSTALGNQLTSNNIFFNGSNAVDANGGTNPKLYTPISWNQGSSYSHLDEATYAAGNPNSLMTPRLGTGEAIHNPGDITLSIFEDMGWTVNNSIAETGTITNLIDNPQTLTLDRNNSNPVVSAQPLSFENIENNILETVNVDSLTGTSNSSRVLPGMQTLKATESADTFMLGDASQAYYDKMGIQDYALIMGFDSSSDTIQLHGSASEYQLGAAPEELPQGTGIFVKNSTSNELVGVVSGVSDLTLDSSSFSFV